MGWAWSVWALERRQLVSKNLYEVGVLPTQLTGGGALPGAGKSQCKSTKAGVCLVLWPEV